MNKKLNVLDNSSTKYLSLAVKWTLYNYLKDLSDKTGKSISKTLSSIIKDHKKGAAK